MSEYDDDSFDDGFDEDQLAQQLQGNLWRKLFAYTLPYKRDMIVLGSAAFVTACLEVAFPLITRAVIDEANLNGVNADLWPYAWIFLGCTLLFGLSIGAFVWTGGKIRTHVAHNIRKAGFANLQRLSFAFYDYRPVGWLMARMTSDCERLSNILAWGVMDLIWGSTMMLGIAIAMLVMNAKLALVVLAIIPVLLWVSAWFERRILRSAREVRRNNSRITGSYNEGIMGVVTSKSFVREEANLHDFEHLTGSMFNASMMNQIQAAVYVPIVLTLASIAIGLTLAIGGIDLSIGVISAGTLIAFMTYARHFFDPVEQLGRWFAELQMAQASAERILSLIEAKPDVDDDDDVLAAIAAQQTAPARTRIAGDGGAEKISKIELKNVAFAYDPKQPVLRDINLTVRAGETIAIVGPTGGGKTTLVNLVCRFYEPTSGQVFIDDVDYRRRSLSWLQSNLGIVLQTAHVFGGSIRDNIRYGRLDATDAEIADAVQMAGAADFVNALPGAMDYEVGEGGNRLSAGQKQLISFARAILADPQILVMDEATSSVDTETEQRIQTGLTNVLAGRIAFVIAHRLSTIRNADRILVIERGTITEAGTHEELVAQQGHYYDLYRQQSLQVSTEQLAAEGGLAS